jgi:hypothetical protein
MTDKANAYRGLSGYFAGHGFTAHGAGQYDNLKTARCTRYSRSSGAA